MTTTTDTAPAAMSAAEASRYQQLRGHLAALNLATAAEQLPGVPDAARAEKLTLTTAMERLLRAEVDATEARRLAGRMRFACLPTPATLEDFDYDAQPGVDRRLINDLASCRYLATATNVLLIGPPGVGKTMLLDATPAAADSPTAPNPSMPAPATSEPPATPNAPPSDKPPRRRPFGGHFR